MRNFQLVLQHGSPSSTDSTQIVVQGSTTLTVAGVDALCTFTIDQTDEHIAALVKTSSQGFADQSDITTGPVETMGPDGYAGDIEIQVTFPGTCPSVGDAISHFVGDLADAAGLGIIRQCVPDALSVFFDCVVYNEFQVTLSKSAATSNKWALSNVSAQLGLNGLQDVLNLFAPAITFQDPQLYFEVVNPTTSSVSFVFTLVFVNLR
jgi:hypothetical protein